MKLKHGDGMKGWPTQAPFDGIIVAAAPLTVPEALVEQLAVGGRLVVPVGPEGQQQLLRITRRENGHAPGNAGRGVLRAHAGRSHLKITGRPGSFRARYSILARIETP